MLEQEEELPGRLNVRIMKGISGKTHHIWGDSNKCHPWGYQTLGTELTDLWGCSVYIQ